MTAPTYTLARQNPNETARDRKVRRLIYQFRHARKESRREEARKKLQELGVKIYSEEEKEKYET